MKFLLMVLLLTTAQVLSVTPVYGEDNNDRWKLIWEDHFNGNDLDTTKWTVIDTSPDEYDKSPDWIKHMIADNQVYAIEDGKLWLKGIVNPGDENDQRPYLTGGVNSRHKFSFLYGKIVIRAKKECAHGAWPALWMMPEEPTYGGWPHSGEIDIMEHLNFDSVIYHTIHTRYSNVLNHSTNPPKGTGDVVADVTEWSVYGLEWYPDVLIWTVDGTETFRYPRIEGVDEDMKQWPFDQPFFIILSQQLGGSWVGKVNSDDLPVSFLIDYVKVYEER